MINYKTGLFKWASLVLFVKCLTFFNCFGKEYPIFRLKGTDGNFYEQTSFDGKDFVSIVLYSNHCRISQSFEELIKETAEILLADNSILILVSPNHEKSIYPDELAYSDLGDSYNDMIIRYKERNFNFPFLYDGENQTIANQLDASSTPHAYLFNKQRKLIYSGRIGDYSEPKNTAKSDLLICYRKARNGTAKQSFSTKVHGTAIKGKQKVHLADEVRRRYSEEKIVVRHVKEKTLNFFLKYNTGKPYLCYLWSPNDEESRANLLYLSEIYKIFRKRGLRIFTISVDKDERKTIEFLEKAQMSSTNLIIPGDQVSPIAAFLPDDTTTITPLTILFNSKNVPIHNKVGMVEPLIIKRLVLDEMNKKTE